MINTPDGEMNNTTSEIQYITINGVRLRYEISGQGMPLVLMHGWGCSLETVRSIAKTASLTNKVYNIDFPGFGESEEPADVWGVEEYTKLVEEFCKKLDISAPILIGHSFGGRVGILFSSRNEVKKLILVDAAGIKPKRSLKYYLKVYSYKTIKNLIKLLYSKGKAQAKINKLRSKRGSADYNSSTPMMQNILSKVVNEDLKAVLPSIKAPTLLIWGTNDTATPLRDAKIMEKNIPDAGLVAFENAGHYSFLDQPYAFASVLSSFLKS